MHYFLGVIVLLILGLALPTQFLVLAIVFLLCSAIVVRIGAQLVTGNAPALTDCVKAVIYSFAFGVMAAVLGFKLLVTVPAVALVGVPLLIVFSQAWAYRVALSISLGAGFVLSLVVTALGTGLSLLFGLSASVLMHAIR